MKKRIFISGKNAFRFYFGRIVCTPATSKIAVFVANEIAFVCASHKAILLKLKPNFPDLASCFVLKIYHT